MKRWEWVLLVILVQLVSFVTGSNLYKLWVYYAGSSCQGTPYNTYTESDESCTIEKCIEDGNMSSTGVGVATIDCTSNYKTSTRNFFGIFPFIMVEVFADSECETLAYAQAFFASSNCEGSPHLNSTQAVHVIAKLEPDGSAVLEYYRDSLCDRSELDTIYYADKDILTTHKCDGNWTKWYYIDGDDDFDANSAASESENKDASDNHNNGIKASAIVGILVGVVLVIILIALGICCCKRQSSVKQPTGSLQSGNTASLDIALHGQVGLWDDDVITANRIPRDKVLVKNIISRGAFGEVYEGIFNGKQVAVKMLLPQTSGNIKQVNDFLAEAKMTATLDHPHIVAFIGVAWDSLADICVVLEFMDEGDLRALLTKYQESGLPKGFNRQKTTIALQLCHALTYLHSLMPPSFIEI